MAQISSGRCSPVALHAQHSHCLLRPSCCHSPVRPRTCKASTPIKDIGHRTGGMSHTVPSRQRHSTACRAQLSPDNTSILVCGGGGVALNVTRQLKNMGAWVWQLQRSDSRRSEIEEMMALVVKGDALKAEDVERVFSEIEDVDAVISSIGGSPADPAADSQGNINLIDAAVKHKVKRFVLITSIGTGDSSSAPPPQVYDVLKPVLVEKSKAEDHLKKVAGDMEYVIIRPGGLKSEPATGNGVLTEDTSVCGAINREDVATLVVKALFSGRAKNKVLSAVDRDQVMGSAEYDLYTI